MAVIPLNAATTTINGEEYSTVDLAAGANITGVVLRRQLENDNSVKVRPTNVTATIGTVAATATAGEPNYILLHNGPAGGFNQGGVISAAAITVAVNGVVEAIITE